MCRAHESLLHPTYTAILQVNENDIGKVYGIHTIKDWMPANE